MEPNRDVGSLEKTPQVVGFLLRLRSHFLAKGSEHFDVHAELPRAALIRPGPGDATVQQDDRSKPALILVHLLVVSSVHKVVSTALAPSALCPHPPSIQPFVSAPSLFAKYATSWARVNGPPLRASRIIAVASSSFNPARWIHLCSRGSLVGMRPRT